MIILEIKNMSELSQNLVFSIRPDSYYLSLSVGTLENQLNFKVLEYDFDLSRACISADMFAEGRNRVSREHMRPPLFYVE